MDDSDLIIALKDYRWPEVWTNVKQEAAGGERSLYKAFLLISWWQEPELAKEFVSMSKSEDTSISLFLLALTYLCLGNVARSEFYTSRLKRRKAPSWMLGWIEIEYLGRSRKFDKLTKLFSRIITESDKAKEAWPYAAMLQCLNQPDVDLSNFDRVFDKNQVLHELSEVLKVRFQHRSLHEIVNNLDLTQNCPVVCLVKSLSASKHYSEGRVSEALLSFDDMARWKFLDKPILNEWLGLSLSHPLGVDSFIERIKQALAVAPETGRAQGLIVSFLMIYYWVHGDYVGMHRAVKNTYSFLNYLRYDKSIDITEKNNRVFYAYVTALAIEWQADRGRYATDDNISQLNVIGESHSLSPANRCFNFLKNKVIAKTKFVFGVKMFHLSHGVQNVYKSCIREHFQNTPVSDPILLTIGEIDCRPDEGIWYSHKKLRRDLNGLVKETVDGYLGYIANLANGREFNRIIVQGIPAPSYPLEGWLSREEQQCFLDMILTVNKYLMKKSLDTGFGFLDVYAATAGEGGTSNACWHIDSHHLKPSFYDQCDKWIVVGQGDCT